MTGVQTCALPICELQPILDTDLSVPVVVEYKLGAGAAIGINHVAKATTTDVLLMVLDSTLLTANVLAKNSNLEEFKFLSVLGTTSTALAVAKNSTYKNLSAWQNKTINLGTNGFGGPHHYYSHLLQQSIRATIIPVHFKGLGDAMPALLGGHIDAFWGSTATLMPYEQAAKIDIIATLSPDANKLPGLDTIPTFKELGLTKLSMATIWIIVSNTSADPDYVAKVQRVLNKITPKTHPGLYARTNIQPHSGQYKKIGRAHV